MIYALCPRHKVGGVGAHALAAFVIIDVAMSRPSFDTLASNTLTLQPRMSCKCLTSSS